MNSISDPPPATIAPFQPVAIVGMAALFPDSDGTGPFWRNIAAGLDSIREVPPDHWLIQDLYSANPADPLKVYATRGGFLPRVAFDPLAFGLPPNNLESTDSVQLLALLVAKRLLDDTRSMGQAKLDPARIGVVLGLASATSLMEEMAAKIQRPVWTKVMREQGLPESQVERICRGIEREYVPWSAATFPGMLGNVVAGRITNRFGLGGINCVVDAACASSLAAMSLAVKSLNAGETDLVITGGADTLDTDFTFMCFSRTPALSATGDCRPFAADADGTILAEGIGMLALRRLADAERDGDTIYAVIRGVGASSDGRGKRVFAPSAGGQVLALERAYQQAGLDPGDVELIECHGTATRAGDGEELAGLAQAFGSSPARVALGSIKSQIGHAKAASGAAALCKAALALRHKVYPPTLKVAAPIPFPFEPTPFYLNTLERPWIHPADTPRRAGVSSFGFGGSNFHAVLEEHRGPAPARFPTAGKVTPALAKGLIIDDFDRGAVTRLEVEQVPAGGVPGLRFTLRDLQGQVRYRLAAELTEAPPAEPGPGPEPLVLQPLPSTLDEIYGPAGVFHGPAFQCIEPPVYLSDLGFEAFFRGPGQPPRGASPAPDFIRLDGGAQACGIHQLHTNGRRSLPVGFESMRILAADPVPEIRSCRGYLKSMGRFQVLADLHYFDPQGAPVAVVEGLSGLLLGADAWDAPLPPSA